MGIILFSTDSSEPGIKGPLSPPSSAFLIPLFSATVKRPAQLPSSREGYRPAVSALFPSGEENSEPPPGYRPLRAGCAYPGLLWLPVCDDHRGGGCGHPTPRGGNPWIDGRLFHPELVEGCIATPFRLRQPQHDRLSLQPPYNYGLTSKSD